MDQAWSLQNGTDPSAPSNPIDPILDDLQLEIKDVIISFETRFRRMKRAGERVFASVSDASKSDIGGAGDWGSLIREPERCLRLASSSSPASLPPRFELDFAADLLFLFPPSLYVRFRFAFTGGRSPALPDPELADSLGGTLLTVKCSNVLVYGDNV